MEIVQSKKTRGVLATVLIVSLALHMIGLVIFGAIRLAQHVLREEAVFELPPVEVVQEEPEYNVNLKRQNVSSSPPPPVAMTVANPQDITVPTLDVNVNVTSTSAYGRGTGGFGSGSGGARAVDLTSLGYADYVVGTLEGTLYDFKKDKDGRSLVGELPVEEMNQGIWDRMTELTRDFVNSSSWSMSTLNRTYFSADKKLYASYFIIPFQRAELAPRTFGAADEIDPISIAVIYRGTFTPWESGRFRLVGFADDQLVVRINNRVVLDAGIAKLTDDEYEATDMQLFGVDLVPDWKARRSEWMRWTEGKPMGMEIWISEAPGGHIGAYLLVEKEGEEGLRIFSTKPLTTKEVQQLRASHPHASRFL